ncbi:MAG TPA: ribulose-phosphate 3-epimerase [Acidimicrobiales bacterium]|jgi:ribulose-phosphate 3-epimerase|nr:ribulose-phosphate 3-epimerase [Acidimicrobiales bacterium]
MSRIAPSILSADFACLAESVAAVAPEADLLHVDVMDGHFVPNLTIGPPVIKSLRARTDLYFDCHLMVDNPGDFLDDFMAAGANGCSVHVELPDVVPLFGEMRRLGLDVGLAVNPETPVEACLPHLPHIDLLLMMTVHPGFGGQSFIPDVMDKVKVARQEIDRRGLKIALQVDGGINEDTAPIAAAAGADTFVAGSAIFHAENPLEAARRIRKSVA